MSASTDGQDGLAAVADPGELGELGVCQLKRMWSRSLAERQGRQFAAANEEGLLDRLVLHALGLGLEQGKQYLFQRAPGFAEFERWIMATAGAPEPELTARLNAAVLGQE